MSKTAQTARSDWNSSTGRRTISSNDSNGSPRRRAVQRAGDSWSRVIDAVASKSSRTDSRIAADAGRDLARRLLEGVVRLDRFELQAELGVGSFGYVFRAWDPRLERVVALKVQRAGSLASPEEAERFLREARSAAQLKHPSIVATYETGQTEDNIWFLVCEYIDGVTLEQRLKEGPFSPEQAAAIVGELADALQYAHEQGVVHRDVKPSNIILDSQQRAHVMDFGLAKRDTGDLTMTSDGRVLGTPAYMSPEQAAGASHEVDARSDIYSLGVVLYEMLTGERPFHGNRRLLLLQVLEDDPRPPHAVKPGLPRDLEVICLKAMSKAPSRRYQTAREMADDLRRFAEGQPILARPMGPVERTLRWCRRYPLAVSVLVAVLVGSAAGLWYLSSLTEYFVRQTALESARLETKMLDEVWRFYSDEISDIDPATTNVVITENYQHHASLAAVAGHVRHRLGRADQPPQSRHGSPRLQPLPLADAQRRRAAGRIRPGGPGVSGSTRQARRSIRRPSTPISWTRTAAASCSTTPPGTWRRAVSAVTTIPTAAARRRTGRKATWSGC